MDAVTGWWDDYFWGSMIVVQVFFFALILMIIFGLIGAAAKLSNSKIAHNIAGAYTVVFRGSPSSERYPSMRVRTNSAGSPGP